MGPPAAVHEALSNNHRPNNPLKLYLKNRREVEQQHLNERARLSQGNTLCVNKQSPYSLEIRRRNSRSNGHDPYAALVAARARSPLASSPNEDSAQLQRLVQSQQQTISLLVSEKASLTTALERLEGLDERYGSVSGQLEASKRAAQTLESRSRDLEEELSRCQKIHEQLVVKERSTSESLKQRERDLELARKETLDTQHKATSLETALRDLKEQIQADDRAEKLEASLKSLQDRSNSLESQLAKTKQILAQSKSEKDGLSSQLTELRTKEEAAVVQRDTLRTQLTELQTKFDALATEKGALQSAHDDLSGQAKKHNDALAELTRKISVEHGKSALHEKKLKSLQAELTAANRRAEEAEHAHKGLQNENVGLMASLNEMRPRIMQITEEKFDLTEKIERLEEERSDFQETIAKMESEADEARAQIERFEGEKAELQAQYDADRKAMEQSMEHAQQSIMQTEEELQLAIRSVQDLEAERGVHRQAVERYQIEMDKLDAELATLRAQFTTLQDDLAMSQNARAQDAAYLEESHGVVERANGEVEALRGELLAKEEEIERLRAEAAQTNAKRSPSHQRSSSLDKEMFESDGTFELSVARSKIRNLETTVFQEQAKAHSLRKQVNSLEEELHRLRRTSRSQQATPSLQSPSLAPAELETALDSALPPD
ncbi:hypothetical protein FS842_006825, partial [Serendipita sp. 407]